MAPRTLKRIATGTGPILALAVLILASLTLMSGATHDSDTFGEVYSVLLIINAFALIALAALIGLNLVRLLRQVRQRVAGARLTARMLAMFVILAVTPVMVVYYFSLQFLHRGIDSWFDVRTEQALDNALELSQTALGVRMRELLKQMELMAGDLADISAGLAPEQLNDARRLSGASELTLMTSSGNIVASSSTDPTSIVPHRPDNAILLYLRQSRNYIGLDPIGDTGLHIRVVVGLPESVSAGESRILQGLFPISERMSLLADNVQSAYAKYRELVFLRKPLKQSFTLTLSLVLLLSLLTAVWAAFFSARRVVAPLRDLAQGTRAVAEGDYETQLPLSSKDEVGFLVESFNEMTRRLARARDETRQSQQQVEEQRTYLEAVLTRLSSGVVTLDHALNLHTANRAACQILGVELDSAAGKSLQAIAEEHPHLRGLSDTLRPHLADTRNDWREEVILFGASGRQVLMCRGAPLAGGDHALPGHVIVFDDLTTLVQAQRNAAWSEVARRLAHEIKNPLTPIQLSAERLQHKYLKKLAPEDAKGLESLTRTIVHQVEAMKGMVNAFSDYARSPRTQPKLLDLNNLVTEVLELYRAPRKGPKLQTRLGRELPLLEADPDRMRQILHNLIKNALEAGDRGGRAELTIETRCVREATCNYIELRMTDRGSGFPEELLEQVFEPYVTTKREGSGLGLAIVKKIVEEHGGVVRAENDPEGGASVVMRFPVLPTATESAREGSAESRSRSTTTSSLRPSPDSEQGASGRKKAV